MIIVRTFIIMVFLAGQSYGQLLKKTETVGVNGIDLYYEVYGAGEPLLLLHGWTQSSQFWSDYIATYAEDFEVYAIDLRGHGRTAPLTPHFSIQKAAGDLLALLDHLKLEKVKAIGLSYGGLTLLQLASLHSDRIESMVLIGASPNYSGSDNKNLDNTFSFDNLPEQFVEQLRKTHHHGDSQIRALFNPNLNYEIRLTVEDLGRINTKTLVINGDHDEIMGIEGAVTLHQYLPNSDLWIVPNAGHIPIGGIHQPEFLSITATFLKGEDHEATK